MMDLPLKLTIRREYTYELRYDKLALQIWFLTIYVFEKGKVNDLLME